VPHLSNPTVVECSRTGIVALAILSAEWVADKRGAGRQGAGSF
jgi:hypothetical protein